MINKFLNKPISILLLLIFIFGLFPATIFAQPVSPMPSEITKSAFNSHFSKADREINPEQWLSTARLGVSQAIYAWELSASALYENPLLFEEAKNELIKWSEEELETRFSQWLIGRFFGEASEKALMELSAKLNDAQKNYTWHLDEYGNILYDEKTGTPLIIRPDDAPIDKDISSWNSKANQIIKDSYASFDFALENLCAELLEYIPQEMRAGLSALIAESVTAISAKVKNEFENIAAREERILTSNRTRDIWSLRKQSDENAARLFTQNLLAETEKACAQGIEELNAKIEAAYAGAGDLAIIGEEWLKLYKEQFDRGLKAWEEAEERFFIRRIEWEQDSYKLYEEGLEIWEKAFIEFTEQQKKWELQANELFEAGKKLFKDASDELNKNIEDAKKEFELNMQMRIGEGTTKVKALIDMYIITSSAALTAQEYIKFWEDRPNNEKELINAQKMYDSCMEKALEARERILKNFAEIMGTGALKDILSSNASSEDFALDEYQIALIKAKALVLYWEQKTQIAEAVINYSSDLSAGRMTEAESLRAWEAAKNAYNDSLVKYEEELNKLNSTGADLQKQQIVLDELAAALKSEEDVLSKLNAEYAALLGKTIINSDFYLVKLNNYYDYLSKNYNLFSLKGEEALYYNAIIYGMNSGKPEKMESIATSLIELFDLYDIAQENFSIPSAQIICDAIYSKNGDFAENASMFLLEFDNCFIAIPEWLEFELSVWKDSLIEYIAIYAIYNDIDLSRMEKELAFKEIEISERQTEFYNFIYQLYINNEIIFTDEEIEILNNINQELLKDIGIYDNSLVIFQIWDYFINYENSEEKHWREYLTTDYFIDYTSEDEIFYVDSWKEGVLQDSLFSATFFTNRINDIFNMLLDKDYVFLEGDSEYFLNLYYNEAVKINQSYVSIKSIFNEMANLGFNYDLSVLLPNEIEIKLQEAKKALQAQEKIYNAKKDDYFKEAEIFMEKASLYDAQYSKLKKALDNVDAMRFEYEKQDAIQRWASTAYLGVDFLDYENSTVKLTRARTALDVLSSLYNKETERPYENAEYEELYAAYRQKFETTLISVEYEEMFKAAIEQEFNAMEDYYYKFRIALSELGYVDMNYADYASKEDKSEWTVKDLISVKDGQLVFLKDENNKLLGINEDAAVFLTDYFNSNEYINSLRELSERMAGYFENGRDLKTWSYARNYLILSLIENNEELSFLNGFYSGIEQASQNGDIGKLEYQIDVWKKKGSIYSDLSGRSIITNSRGYFEDAWNTLSEQEKKDLEFYIILTLSGNANDYILGFSKYYTYDVYYEAFKIADSKYDDSVREEQSFWIFSRLICKEMVDFNNNTRNITINARNNMKSYVDKWTSGLLNNLSSINNNYASYLETQEKLEYMLKMNPNGVEWEDIQSVLLLTKKYSEEDIAVLETYWAAAQNENKKIYEDVFSALSAIVKWAKKSEEKAAYNLEIFWQNEAKKQFENENAFFETVTAYIAGEDTLASLKTAAEKAYGKNATSWKSHYNNLHNALLDNLSMRENVNFEFQNALYGEFERIEKDLADIAQNALFTRYYMEYAARNVVWDQMKQNIIDKNNEWNTAAELIFENGRKDWEASAQKMNKAYLQWKTNFQEEYNRVKDEWDIAYLAGLEDKESWLQMAADAANNASSESFLSLVGAEGERLSRAMDTREPFGIRYAAPEAQALMAELLQSAGITNMANAFNAVNTITNTSSAVVARGMGGYSVWDANLAKTAATDLAKQTNAEIANRETKILAHNARQSAEDALKNLEKNVDSANKDFQNNMDQFFLLEGFWNKSGNKYKKEVIVNSTLLEPVKTQMAVIAEYKYFVLENLVLQTNMDENYLASLDTIAIRTLIEQVYWEIGEMAKDIFGGKKENEKGKFIEHIGDSPVTKDGKDMGDSKDSMFENQGSGELGRLMSDYIYWKVMEIKGMQTLSMASWDKKIWDDGGSKFQAPTLREVGNVAGIVVSGVLSTAVTIGTFGAGTPLAAGIMIASVVAATADDLLFAALDVGFGYKSFEEAGVEFGKTLAINTANMVIGVAFGGLGCEGLTNLAVNAASSAGGIAGSVSKVVVQTTMTGLQTATTSFVSTTINSITYGVNGFGWSQETFEKGMEQTGKSAIVSMTSTLTTSSLNAISIGEKGAKLFGFNNTNIEDVQKLNGFTGSLAGQGMNYALNGEFTLNLVNLNMLGDKHFNTGLLEMSFTKDNGVKMNLGAGGADISFGTIASAFRGLAVLDVNYKINGYVKNEENEFKSAVALRSQYGFGDDKQVDQLWDILKGEALLKLDEKNYAETTLINGKRIITMGGFKEGMDVSGMSVTDQMLLGVVLGHEAYRDGIVTADNYLETQAATMAHTEMAIRMIYDGYYGILQNENIRNDIAAYSNGTYFFNSYVDAAYDSSADYWKLTLNEDGSIKGFEWDGELTFDLSDLGDGYENKYDSLDDNTLLDLFNRGSIFNDFNDFKAAYSTFETLNTQINAFKPFLATDKDSKNAATKTVFDNLYANLTNAMQNMGNSGLLAGIDAELAEPGAGPQVFINGGGIMTSDSGWRAVTWTSDFNGTFQEHIAWDLIPNDRENIENWKLVAPMNGTLGLDFSVDGGLKLITSNKIGQSITYSHSDANSIMNFVGLFATNGVTMNDGVLGGIAKNMIIGVMGTTGTETTGGHVHLTYTVNGDILNPGIFFNRNQFQKDAYTMNMSGFNFNPATNTLNYAQNSAIYDFLQNYYEGNVNEFYTKLGNNSNMSYTFNSIIELNTRGLR